jgi:hypothetical protein
MRRATLDQIIQRLTNFLQMLNPSLYLLALVLHSAPHVRTIERGIGLEIQEISNLSKCEPESFGMTNKTNSRDGFTRITPKPSVDRPGRLLKKPFSLIESDSLDAHAGVVRAK